jgi:hypothetical protein
MPRVKFHEPSEFEAELKLMANKVVDKIVRITCGLKYEHPSTVLTVIATALIGNLVLCLERGCGSYLMSESQEAEEVRQRANTIQKQIRAAAIEFGLDIRSGMYEP